MQDDVLVLRDTIKVLIRSLGILETNKAFCCDYTYAQCHVLMEVSKAKSINIVELADILKINKSAVSRTVEELVKKGSITREPNPVDRRYINLTLTGAGKIAAETIDANSRQQFKKVLEAIPNEQRHIALQGAQILSQALTAFIKQQE